MNSKLIVLLLGLASMSVAREELVFLDGAYTLGWEVTGTTITIDARVRTTGWIGFGLNNNGGAGMAGADIVIAGFDESDGLRYVGDFHATRDEAPTLDQSQDVELIEATQTDGETYIKFSRPVDSGDAQDVEFTGVNQWFMIAYGEADIVEYHGENNRIKEPIPALAKIKLPQMSLRSILKID